MLSPNDSSSALSASNPNGSCPSLGARAGLVCALALAVSALSAVPSALRAMGAGGSFWGGFLVAASVLLPLLIALLGLFRAAGRGLFSVLGRASDRKPALFVALWIGFSLPPLTLLGTLLKAGTNHRGLGGATFGVLSLGVVAFALLLAYRALQAGQKLAERGVKPWFIAGLGVFISVLPLMLAALPLVRANASDLAARNVQAALIDACISIVGVALLHSFQLGNSLMKRASTIGIPAAVLIFVGGMLALESSRTIGPSMKSGGGLAASLIGMLEAWTDRDNDGVGSHFGGKDCDEGDPARNPNAQDIPGDGIDHNCDGLDIPSDARADLPRAAQGSGSANAASAPSVILSALASNPVVNTPPSPKAGAPAGSKPDIYLITLDSVRADHTSVYGYARKTTPNLEALAAKGLVFERAYAAASDTQRALVPLVSGNRLSKTLRDRREWPTILPENETIAERLKKAGYISAAVTSFTWLSEERGFNQGFDRFEAIYDKAHPERDSTGEYALRSATAILKELESRAQPIFLWIHLFDAHDRYLEHEGISFGKGTVALYNGEVAFVDKILGDFMAAVSKSSRASSPAVFIVHGSHGEAFGEHDFSGHGTELYEEVLRVPLVIAAPGCKAGRYDAGVVSTMDIAPTLLSLAGASAENIEGRSLVEILRGESKALAGPVYARGPRRVALIDGNLKLIVLERKKKDRFLLFDLSADPKETKDLSSERPEDMARLIALRATFESPEKSP